LNGGIKQLRNTCTVNITAGIILPTKTQNQSIHKNSYSAKKKKKSTIPKYKKKIRSDQIRSDQIRSVRDRDRRGWGFTVGEADRCRDLNKNGRKLEASKREVSCSPKEREGCKKLAPTRLIVAFKFTFN
jgi:hypothetical protein